MKTHKLTSNSHLLQIFTHNSFSYVEITERNEND